MSEKPKSVYMLGAEDGLYMGPLMALTVVLIGASTYVAWVGIAGLLCALAVPVLAYWRLAVSYRESAAAMSFPALWLQGISMFFFGGLVMAVVAFVAMRWAVPGFIGHQIDMIVNIYSSSGDPTAIATAKTFEKLRSTGALPSPLDMALELLYIAVFSGSILSATYAWLIRRRRPTPPPFYGSKH